MAVYDCCMFLNENDIYEVRLNQHWDFVDKFIVLEAGETHTGLKKPFNFDQKRFEKYSEKLEYVTFDSFEEEFSKNPQLIDGFMLHDRSHVGQHTADWIRDHFQGNYLFKILLDRGVKDDDLILNSCLDEIISRDAFNRALERFKNKDEKYHMKAGHDYTLREPAGLLRPLFGFELDVYVYKLNLFSETLCASMITEFRNFKTAGLPATLRSMGIHTHECIKNGGWHFTFMDDDDGGRVLTKQRSWAHSKDIYPDQKLKFNHRTKEEALERLFRDYSLKKVDITETTHPKYVVDNLDKYSGFIA